MQPSSQTEAPPEYPFIWDNEEHDTLTILLYANSSECIVVRPDDNEYCAELYMNGVDPYVRTWKNTKKEAFISLISEKTDMIENDMIKQLLEVIE